MPSRSPDRGLKLILLGGFDAYLNGRPVSGISYNKMRALLCYLALERERDHSREALAELLWAGTDPITARGNLRRTLSDLRRALEQPTGKILFSASKDSIRFVPNVHVDALEFAARAPNSPQDHAAPQQRDERIVELYRGEFMAGFSLPDCPDFDDWLLTQREALHRRALALLEQLSNRYESIDGYGKALQFALRHSELEPWDEGAQRRVMRLYALNGQNSAALVQYDACCRLLKNELGVLPSQETQQLAERIRNGELLRVSPDPTAPPRQAIVPAPAERRQVSVLYCELALAEIDDPDEAMALLRAPQARCVEIIRRCSGHIVQAHGGGLLAYFGYPQTYEDSTRRAVQAALAVTCEAGHGVEIRAGVHTGLIITGGDPSLPDTVGKTSRIAIQLRHGIGPNAVAISQETHGIVAGYFDCVSLGVQSLPDSAPPVEVFKALRESGARTRLDAVSQLSPLVGRQAEIAQLMQFWEDARKGVRSVVLVTGEPGIGKSRLLHALKLRLTGQPHAVRELRCFPEFSQSPFYPLLAAFETHLGFAAGDAAEMKSDKLAQYLERDYPALSQQAVPLLASLYSLPQPGHYQACGSSPQKQKELTIDILLAMLKLLALRQPVLFIVEDLHWIDPSTLELLTVLVRNKGPANMLAVFTVRPEFVPPWNEHLASALALAPLAGNEVEELIASISEGIPATTVRRIVERADGVPLFAEEMAKIATLDNRASIPATLHDLLAARMDRLGEAKYTAQLAATLGREFGLDLLRKVSLCDPAALARSLSTLQHAGLIMKLDAASCQFKHALIQEAAFQSQTKSDRQAAHRRIAQVLQGDFPDSVATRPELLAQHLSSAGEIRQSIEYWIKAGQRAIHASANLEAIAHFNSGLRLLMTLPAAQERDQTEFSILVSLSTALHATQGYGSEEATRVSARISALRELVGTGFEVFHAEWTRLRNTIANVGPRGVPEAAMRLLNLAHDDPVRKQAAHYVRAIASFWLGEFESSRVHAAMAIALYHPDQHPIMLDLFGEDLSVSFAGHMSWALCFLGFPDRAQQVCGRMLDQAREMEHPKTLAMALLFASMLPRWLNKHTETLSLSAETIALTRKQGMLHWLATSEALHGWAQVMHQGRQDLSELQSLGVRLTQASPAYSALRLCGLAEAHAHLKMYDEALGLLAQAQADEIKTGSCQFAAERHRLQGLCLLARSPPNAKAAQACFDQALAISRQQGAKTLELRVAMSMARLWRQQGKNNDARRLLENTYNWFTEGFDAPDLQEATKLLGTLI